MSYKKLSLIVLTIIVATSGIGIWLATQIKTFGGTTAFVGGPKFYPIMIFSLLIVFGIIDAINTVRKQEDKTISIPNLKYLLFTVGMMIIWIFLWKLAVGFYPASALCIAIMLYVLNPSSSIKKKVITAIAVDAIIVAFLYIVFSMIFFVNF